jgi:hypothetical protein
MIAIVDDMIVDCFFALIFIAGCRGVRGCPARERAPADPGASLSLLTRQTNEEQTSNREK